MYKIYKRYVEFKNNLLLLFIKMVTNISLMLAKRQHRYQRRLNRYAYAIKWFQLCEDYENGDDTAVALGGQIFRRNGTIVTTVYRR